MCSVVFTGLVGYSLRHIRLQPPPHKVTASATYGYSPRYIRLQPLLHIRLQPPLHIRLQPPLHIRLQPPLHIRLQPPLHMVTASVTYGDSLCFIRSQPLRSDTAPTTYGYSPRYRAYGYSLRYILLQPPLHMVTAFATYGYSRYIQIQPSLHTVAASATNSCSLHYIRSCPYCYCFTYGYFAAIFYKNLVK